MKPEPSIRIRCPSGPEAGGASATGSAMAMSSGTLVSVVVPGARLQPINAGAVGAEGLVVGDVQPDSGMAERPAAAVAGHDPAVDHEGLGLAHIGRGRVGLGRHRNPLVGGGAWMIALAA